MIDNTQNIQRFEDLLLQVDREGINELLEYIREKTDFYTAPASTQYHLSCEGGLLQHSLNVYDCLMAKKLSPAWEEILSEVSDESLTIMALLHDLCKVNFYVRGYKNQKSYDLDKIATAEPWQVKHDDQGSFIWETVLKYDIDDKMPLGHGEKSVIIINCFMKLKVKELFAIRWHMGYCEEKSQYNALGKAIDKYPVVLALHEADLEATKLLEDNNDNKNRM